MKYYEIKRSYNMKQEEINEVLRLHELWLKGKENGKQAVLCNVMLNDVDLCGANLRMAKMNWVYLCRAKLRDADLSFAELRGANLRLADLRGADLNCANLSGADLTGADLSNANLCKSCLFNADLNCANLHMASLGYNTCFACSKGAPVYQTACGFGSRNGVLTLLAQGKRDEWRWFTGCFKGSEAELKKAVQEKYGNTAEERRYLRAIDYLTAQAEDNALSPGGWLNYPD